MTDSALDELEAIVSDFAGWLRARKGRRTYRQIAWRAGIDHTTVARLARGQRQPSFRVAIALIGELGTGR